MDDYEIKQRLYDLLETNSLQLQEFLKLTDIKVVDEGIDTACVTCTSAPTLYLNRKFVEEHCKTNKHLLMLIMHELYHIILGHTFMLKAHNDLDNICFDAVINALLCRNFKDKEYTSFFESLNPSSSFPACLLRPLADDTPKDYRDLLTLLYTSDYATYREIYESLYKKIDELIKDGKCKVTLLGNHTGEPCDNPFIDDIVNRMSKNWDSDNKNYMRGFSDEIETEKTNLKKQSDKRYRKLNKLIKDACYESFNNSVSSEVKIGKVEGVTVIPNYKDRTYFGKSMLSNSPILYKTEYTTRTISESYNNETMIYLDVSGSVQNEIGKFFYLLKKPLRERRCKLYGFSNKVDHITYDNLIKGVYKTTGGTDLDCVFDHYFKNKKNNNKILIITDGYTGLPNNKNLNLIKKNNVKIYVGVVNRYIPKDISKLTKHYTLINQR